MEANFTVEKEDLPKAKHDLLMRFIRDQEQLQTTQVGLKPSNDDTTFDILDGLDVPRDNSSNICLKGGRNLVNNTTQKLNEHSEADSGDVQQHMAARTKTCIPDFRNSLSAESKEKQLRLKSGKKLVQDRPVAERPATGGTVRRLRSAPLFSGRQSSNLLRSGDINLDIKARKVSSLSIVVPNESERRRPSLTCAQVTRPAGNRAVGISAVDMELFDKHRMSSITGPYAMFQLPPIASETTQTPPPTL